MKSTLGKVIGGFTSAVTFAALVASAKDAKKYTTWSDYEGSADSAQYSALTQINKSNVTRLQQVWFYPDGNNGFRYGFNPLVVDGVMYVVGKDNTTVALDAATGRGGFGFTTTAFLGASPTAASIIGRAQIAATVACSTPRTICCMHWMRAPASWWIHSATMEVSICGKRLGRDPKTIRSIQSGGPGRVLKISSSSGSSTGEGYGSPPGDIRAYDVLAARWCGFGTVPHPGEFGYDTWPKDAWKYIGGTNDWGGMTIDEKRGIAYFPLGSPTYDFYGADRTGAGLFGDCLLALDARTGKYMWHFQAVRR